MKICTVRQNWLSSEKLWQHSDVHYDHHMQETFPFNSYNQHYNYDKYDEFNKIEVIIKQNEVIITLHQTHL